MVFAAEGLQGVENMKPIKQNELIALDVVRCAVDSSVRAVLPDARIEYVAMDIWAQSAPMVTSVVSGIMHVQGVFVRYLVHVRWKSFRSAEVEIKLEFCRAASTYRYDGVDVACEQLGLPYVPSNLDTLENLTKGIKKPVERVLEWHEVG